MLLFEQGGSSSATPSLVVLVFWLTIIFATFGLFAPRNATVIAMLFLCALSISGAIFLILELDTPFEGLVQISSAPMRDAIARMASKRATQAWARAMPLRAGRPTKTPSSVVARAV